MDGQISPKRLIDIIDNPFEEEETMGTVGYDHLNERDDLDIVERLLHQKKNRQKFL